jgi:excisionase family DNA binding protein
MGKEKNLPNNYQSDYLTRADVASLFKISLVTVHQWTQQGIFKAYRLGTRVYFKRSEIDNALTVIVPKNARALPVHKGVSRG